MYMKKDYTTGKFAKMANVTERTIRYYDKIGLLKPSFIMPNGYRKYSEKDFLKLQRIISLKHLGFALEEIYPMLLDDDQESFQKSLDIQIELVDKKITHLLSLKEALLKTNKLVDNGKVEWDRIVDLIKLTNEENSFTEQYRTANNLKIRINLHNKYSINKQGWFSWVYHLIDFSKINKLLEIGCGTGDLWKHLDIDLRHREIFLTDKSSTILEKARENLGHGFHYMAMDGENITFKKEYFDAIIANHVLFYFKDVSNGLAEIQRVLHKGGLLYCSAYGKEHMREIHDIMFTYNPKIKLVENNLYEKFGLENGKAKLQTYFNKVELHIYEDELVIDEAQPLIDYILSCPGNQKEIIGGNILDFVNYIENIIKERGSINITKQVGIFICEK